MLEDDQKTREKVSYDSGGQDIVAARAPRRIRVTGLRCTAPSSHQYFLALQAGGESLVTPVLRGKSLQWNDHFTVPVVGTASLSVQLCRRRWRLIPFRDVPDECVGQIAVQLPNRAEDTPVSEALVSAKDSDQHLGSIAFSYVDVDVQADVDATPPGLFDENGKVTKTAQVATQLVTKMRSPHSTALTAASALQHAEDTAGTFADAADVWSPLLDKLEVFVKISTAVASIHPYASMALMVFNAIPKALIAQKKLDDSVRALVDAMNAAMKLMQSAGDLLESENRCRMAKSIASKLIDCGLFIQNYARTAGFAPRLFENLPQNTKETIDEYSKSLEELIDLFKGHTIVETNVIASKVLQSLSSLESELTLDEMLYGYGAEYEPEKACLEGTRGILIQEICKWAMSYHDSDTTRTLWLSGVAGAGKSAVAHSIAMIFDGMAPTRLGCFYGFSTSDRRRSVEALFPTISRNLADMEPDWKKALLEVVRGSRSLRTTDSLERQFKHFLLETADMVKDRVLGPILVVIDALDESPSEAARSELLKLLARLGELPVNFRFLITSRPEPDICEALGGVSSIQHIDMSAQDGDVVRADLSRFVDHQLSKLERSRAAVRNDVRWDRARIVKELVRYADESFLWASTSCRFIHGVGESKDYDWCDRFEAAVSLGSHRGGDAPRYQHLDSLYDAILMRLFPLKEGKTASRRFTCILGRLLACREPLPLSGFEELRGDEESPGWASTILGNMGSLLYGVTERNACVRPLHSSFREYLIDPQRSGCYHVDLDSSSAIIAHSSMRTLANALSFNMCNLKTSYLSNKDHPDLAERIRTGMSPALIYSSLHWASHLSGAAMTPSLLKLVDRFVMEKALFWLESLSLLGCVPLAAPALSTLLCVLPHTWCAENHRRELIEDLQRFARSFAYPISISAPHIYISALPFSPANSSLSKHYKPLFSKTASVLRGRDEEWPAAQAIMRGHSEGVTSIAFSSDGKHLVSGSIDTTVRLWDANTAQPIGDPFTDHSKPVVFATFSSDGASVLSVSNDRSMRIWNFVKDRTSGSPVSFSDTTRIASYTSGSHGTTRLCSIKAGQSVDPSVLPDSPDNPDARLVSGVGNRAQTAFSALNEVFRDSYPVHRGIFNCVAFSPDRKSVATGFQNGMVQLWDANIKRPLGEPLKGSIRQPITSVAHSPDGGLLVTGSDMGTLQMWDISTQNALGDPFQGHSGRITAIAFSPDGKRFASASNDRTVRLWDADVAQALVRKEGEGDSTHVTSLAFSPDGSCIASGSKAGVVCLWNAKNGESIMKPFQGFGDDVTSVAFSRDGRRVVVGFIDGTMRILDVENGSLVQRLPSVSACSSPSQGGRQAAILEWIAVRNRINPSIGHTNSITSVAFSLDGRRVFSGSKDKTIRIWDVESGEVIGLPLRGHAASVTCLAVSPEGKRLISASRDKKVRMWDAETGAHIGLQPSGHDAPVTSIAFSPDGTRFVTGSEESKILLCDASTLQIIGAPLYGHRDSVNSVAFSSDGNMIASGSSDRTVRMWDARTGQVMGSPLPHPSPVTSVYFSPDGKRVVSGSRDNLLRVWDVAKGYHPPQSPVSDPAVSLVGNAQEMAAVTLTDLRKMTSSPSFLAMSEKAEHALRDVHLLIPDAAELSQCELEASLKLTEDGWVVGPGGNRLLWIPDAHRSRVIVHPRRLLIPAENMTTLNLSDCAHGTRWHECHTSSMRHM